MGARVRSWIIAPVAAMGWLSFALLGGVVKLALFRSYRAPEVVALLWGVGFAAFLWAGALSVRFSEARAIPFALGGGAAIAIFVYARGAALDNPPAGQPGEVFRRRAVRQSPEPVPTKQRELHRARVELTDDDVDGAVFYLRQAAQVAVAQRKLDELLEVRDVLSTLPKTPGTERLAWTVDNDLRVFGVGVRSAEEIIESLRARVGAHPRTRDLERARRALDEGKLADALFLLQQARLVAVAQRRPELLLEVYDLVRPLSGTAAEALVRKVEADLRAYP